jgi:hypothetical protein
MVILTPFTSKCDEFEGIFPIKSYGGVEGLFFPPIGDVLPIEKC